MRLRRSVLCWRERPFRRAVRAAGGNVIGRWHLARVAMVLAAGAVVLTGCG
ncbi:MAG: hypothetical protein ACYTFI_17295 [Planctomycetota bacterium]